MISETLAEQLESYGIGRELRALRKKKKLGLVQLGEHTGLSPGMLSKIERGQLVPTLPTLLRIAMVFGVGLEHFFSQNRADTSAVVVRRADRIRLPNRPGKEAPSYFFESLDFQATDRRMDAYLAHFPRGSEPSDPHDHEGGELIFVISGGLSVTIDGTQTDLDEGDAMYFDSAAPHSYAGGNRLNSIAIVVVAR